MKTVYSLLCGFMFISLLASCSEADIEKAPAPAAAKIEVEKQPEAVTKNQTEQVTEEAVEEKQEQPVKVVRQAIDDSNAKFKEGTHYQTVKQTATATPEIMEFFSFYCPHCLKFEPLIGALKANLPSDVKIKKNHVDFIGRENGPFLTRAYAAAQILQVEDKLANILFDQIHTQGKKSFNEDDILASFVKVGVSEEEAKGALASFPVKGLASQMKRDTETFQISGVPTIIVNGKYKVNTGSVNSTDEFIALVDFLTKKND